MNIDKSINSNNDGLNISENLSALSLKGSEKKNSNVLQQETKNR
jgi:hypothetical protein